MTDVSYVVVRKKCFLEIFGGFYISTDVFYNSDLHKINFVANIVQL